MSIQCMKDAAHQVDDLEHEAFYVIETETGERTVWQFYRSSIIGVEARWYQCADQGGIEFTEATKIIRTVRLGNK